MNFAEEFKDMKDILFTADLAFEHGDFTIAESDNQHTQHILIAQIGESKASPARGVGIEQMLNSEEPMEFLIEAKKNLEYDGQKVDNISFTENKTIKVEAKYL